MSAASCPRSQWAPARRRGAAGRDALNAGFLGFSTLGSFSFDLNSL
jgi:hypothetical protein